MKKVCVIVFVSILSFGCASIKGTDSIKDKMSLSDSDIVRLLSTLPISPLSDIPLHIVIEKRDDQVLIIRICQSRFSSRSDFNRKFRINKCEVFIYAFDGNGADHSIFFSQDSPTWRIMAYKYLEVIQFFKLELIDM